MEDSSTDKLLMELRNLQEEHADLKFILTNTHQNPIDEFTMHRIKKRKLMIKDRISQLKSVLFPDIIA
ncbi:MAG: DUF465 domain-containing protein [Rickettsiaceae bacterium]|nr:DUF465 domain-containing protein [Rickettsiaceae bacterium]